VKPFVPEIWKAPHRRFRPSHASEQRMERSQSQLACNSKERCGSAW
jgi:hypothetical protein